MSDETTQNLPDRQSFEDRVFARFDALESRFDAVESRLTALESQAERRALETKPIWERALAEIVEVKERLTSLEHLTHQMVRKIDVLSKDMLTLRADQAGLEDRLDRLDSEPAKS